MTTQILTQPAKDAAIGSPVNPWSDNPDFHRVLHATQLRPAGNGWRLSGVVLAAAPPSEHSRYVTWEFYQNDDGTFGVQSGHYFDSYPQADRDYTERGGLW